MKPMKVICTLRDMMNQEFQHCSESRLIEVMIVKMHTIQFGLIVNLIQMKWMKVIDALKDMMNQEFQHCSESRLIEVMILKMHPIQFGLIVNLTQTKLSEISCSF
jgi:flagellar biosynthesis/type III secretory pathway chaperone